MPTIDPIANPAGSRILVNRFGDVADEEKILEWAPAGDYLKLQARGGQIHWEQKRITNSVIIEILVTTPPVV